LRPYFLLEPGDGLLICGGEGRVRYLDRTAHERLGHQSQNWLNESLQTCWPQLADLIIENGRRLDQGPRDHVLALPHANGVELATRVRLFRTDSGIGVGILQRRAQRFDQDPSSGPEDTYRRLLEAVLDTALDGVLVTLADPLESPGPLIVYANQAVLDQTGYALHEVLGRSPRMFQGPDTCQQTRAELAAAMRQWQPASVQLLNYRRDHSPCWIELKVAPLSDPTGWHSHWVSIQRDISERVTNQQALARDAKQLAERLQAVTQSTKESNASVTLS
jgi:PAS domain S-box-containing protein